MKIMDIFEQYQRRIEEIPKSLWNSPFWPRAFTVVHCKQGIEVGCGSGVDLGGVWGG